ncbi:hypothetical protein HOF78_02305 [Candidatus Woesearchaeota archaeon]|jgi:hypothetical protein|nr:hypothetical protein [Candidatus Woesearchaeota archaeon]MBT6044875.1 hypothetical protein [Candidatus Woesearchaeota archaeon]
MVVEVTGFSIFALKDRFIELLLAPVNYSEMLWIAVPLILALFLTEIYFSRYKQEELGWNSAYGNALVLLFVSVDIFRYLFNNNMLENMTTKLAIALAVTIMAILLTLINFLHILPENLAYGLSSKLPVNFLAYIALILVYSDIPADFMTFIASVGILVLFAAAIILLRKLIPVSIEEVEY